jgi:hypothetical protein
MKIQLNHAQKRAIAFALAVLVVMFGSMLFEPARSAVTSTIAAAALLGLPVGFVFLVGLVGGNANTAGTQSTTERKSPHA